MQNLRVSQISNEEMCTACLLQKTIDITHFFLKFYNTTRTKSPESAQADSGLLLYNEHVYFAVYQILYTATRISVNSMAYQILPAPAITGSAKMSAPLTTAPRATDAMTEVFAFINDWK